MLRFIFHFKLLITVNQLCKMVMGYVGLVYIIKMYVQCVTFTPFFFLYFRSDKHKVSELYLKDTLSMTVF